MQRFILTILMLLALLLASCRSTGPDYTRIRLPGFADVTMRSKIPEDETLGQKFAHIQGILDSRYPGEHIEILVAPEVSCLIFPGTEPDPTLLVFPLVDIPLLEAVRYFCQFGGGDFEVDGRKVIIRIKK